MSGRRPVAPPIALSDLSVGYHGRAVLSNVDWAFAPGSMTALVGPNGGGKSTLLKTIAGELRPIGGEIRGNDRDLIAYLSQTAGFDRDFPISLRDVVAMGLWRRLGPFGRIGAAEAAQLDAALQAVGLNGLEAQAVGTLSGGQLQRALFARLILLDAPIVLLDEPFSAIDQPTVADLLRIVRGWHEEGRTIVAALHDLDQVRTAFPETMRLEGERAKAGRTEEVLGERGAPRLSFATAEATA